MPTLDELRTALDRLDGRGYKAYKAIAGDYTAPRFTLRVDHVQGDPFAEPSRLRALLPAPSAGLPSWALTTPTRRTATEDYLLRRLGAAFARFTASTGSGRSGELRIVEPGQEVLSRTAVLVSPGGAAEIRFRAGLPARGRTILGPAAAALLTVSVVAAIEEAFALDPAALRHHVETVEDARALRDQLERRGLIAFIANGSILPRRSGVDDRPLPTGRARPFRTPDRLRTILEAPNRGPLPGMGVPAGVTLIVGGGFHGKSTLLRALERGVYDHVPGDGREFVVSIASAVKVRAEDGRAIAGTDISNFITGLPDGADTRRFTTNNASGSTSQAAAIVEALEVGALCLFLDEDTSATNLLIRDARMQALVPDADEPITPLVDRVRTLARDHGVSTVLVVGGAGDYFDVADTVIAMRAYEPEDVTADALRIAAERPTERHAEGGHWVRPAGRAPLPDTVRPSRGRRETSIKVWGRDRLLFGAAEVDLRAVEQIVEPAQLRAMASALAAARGTAIDGTTDFRTALGRIMAAIHRDGLDAVQSEPAGELAAFRIFEIAALLGRLRTLRTAPASTPRQTPAANGPNGVIP